MLAPNGVQIAILVAFLAWATPRRAKFKDGLVKVLSFGLSGWSGLKALSMAAWALEYQAIENGITPVDTNGTVTARESTAVLSGDSRPTRTPVRSLNWFCSCMSEYSCCRS